MKYNKETFIDGYNMGFSVLQELLKEITAYNIGGFLGIASAFIVIFAVFLLIYYIIYFIVNLFIGKNNEI